MGRRKPRRRREKDRRVYPGEPVWTTCHICGRRVVRQESLMIPADDERELLDPDSRVITEWGVLAEPHRCMGRKQT